MPPKRTRGRPRREGADAGRDALVAAARNLLRRQPRININRKELAIEAGVTPAMVNYYFRDQPGLIDAAARPVLDGYLQRLRALLREGRSVDQTFRAMIVLLLEIARDNGQLIDSYVHYVKRRGDKSSDFLAGAYAELSGFFRDCEKARYLRESNLTVTVSSLWGACKVVAQTPEIRTASYSSDASNKIGEYQADIIIDLFIRGLAHPIQEEQRAKPKAFEVPSPQLAPRAY